MSKKSEAIDAYSNLIVNSDSPILWMNAAEVNFLLAEYQLRFAGDKAKAKEYYENGIRLSFPDFDNDSPNSLTRVRDPFN